MAAPTYVWRHYNATVPAGQEVTWVGLQADAGDKIVNGGGWAEPNYSSTDHDTANYVEYSRVPTVGSYIDYDSNSDKQEFVMGFQTWGGSVRVHLWIIVE